MPMEGLAQLLADRLRAPVINMTGLYGDYQMTLDLPFPGASTVATAPGAELPAALESEGVCCFRRWIGSASSSSIGRRPWRC